MGGACSMHQRVEKCISICVEKPEGRSLLEISSRRLEDNIKMYIKEMGVRVWSELDQIRIESIGGLL
jgi:hypothetical protein